MTATRVKICGLTRLDDALAAVAAGADALGFVMWPGSKRAATPDQVAAIVAGLPALVQTVGVFVDATAGEIAGILARTGLAAAQLSGDERPDDYRDLRVPLIKAFRIAPDPAELTAWAAAGYLADGAAPGSYGGTGHGAAEATIQALAPTGRLILAGGLKPDNVGAAVARHRPYGVDVASGVETAPGVKDHSAITAFVRAAKAG